MNKANCMDPIRVLIVEDTHTIRRMLEYLIEQDLHLTVVASVSSGEEALRVLDECRPDVISLDIRLPGITGFDVTRQVMRHRPTPIVVCSASVEADDLKVSMNALAAGALCVVEKPVGFTHQAYDSLAGRLCAQLRLMSQVKVVRQRFAPGIVPPRQPIQSPANSDDATRGCELIGIAASTGGPPALVKLFGDLSADFPVPIVLVQHITASFHEGFVDWLHTMSPLNVATAVAGETPRPGCIHVAPADEHLRVVDGRFRYDDGAPISHQKPSGTVLLESLAADFGARAVGVVLTGMGDDGAAGLRAMRDAGAWTIAESQATAVIYGMPKAAVGCDAVCESLPLPAIGPRLNALACRPAIGVC